MAEQLNLQVNVTGNATQSVQSLKKELREAQTQVAVLSDKFGATSKQAVEAAKRAAELKDRIGDAKALVDAFNPDAKFKALSASLSGVASGYTALQGAIGLFGEENKQLEKQLLKVQSALAFSQGLQGLFESIDSFKNLATVIKTQVVTAFSTLRGAIIATGIGALSIGLGLLIANFDKVKTALYKLIPGLKTVGDFIGGIVDKVSGYLGFKDEEVKKTVQSNKTIVDKEAEKNKQLEVERARAAEERKRKKEQEYKDELARLQRFRDDEAEANRRAFALEMRALENKSAAAKQNAIDENATIESLWEEQNKRDDADQQKLNKKLLLEKQAKEELIKNEYQLADAKFQAASAGLALLGTLVDKNDKLQNALFIADRALAIAQIVISTQREIAAYASNPTWSLLPDGGAAIKASFIAGAKLRAAAGIATVAATTLAKFKGGGTNAGSNFGPSIPTLGLMSPIQPQSTLTGLNQATINALGNQAVKAYVVESDMTSSQKRIEAIKQKAKFG